MSNSWPQGAGGGNSWHRPGSKSKQHSGEQAQMLQQQGQSPRGSLHTIIKPSGRLLARLVTPGPRRTTATSRERHREPQHWSHLETQRQSFKASRLRCLAIGHSHTKLVNFLSPSATCVQLSLLLLWQIGSWPQVPMIEGRGGEAEAKGLSTLKYSGGPHASW